MIPPARLAPALVTALSLAAAIVLALTSLPGQAQERPGPGHEPGNPGAGPGGSGREGHHGEPERIRVPPREPHGGDAPGGPPPGAGHGPGPDFHGPEGPSPSYRTPSWQLDGRYNHNHYYPSRGYIAPRLPGGAVSIAYGSGSYYFHSGVFFRPYGPRFIVVAPPFGIVVPLLPPAFVMLQIGGAPYYYADGVYYRPAASGGYVVVEPPPGADVAQAPPPPPPPKAPPDPIYYPRTGQTPEQTEADRQDCNRWATTQPSAMADASIFQRAVSACMDGRGYTVR